MPHLQALPHIPPQLSRSPPCSGTGAVLSVHGSSCKIILILLTPSTATLFYPSCSYPENQPLPPNFCHTAENIIIPVKKIFVSSPSPGGMTCFSRTYIPISKIQPGRKQLLNLEASHTRKDLNLPCSVNNSCLLQICGWDFKWVLAFPPCLLSPKQDSFQSCSVNSLSHCQSSACVPLTPERGTPKPHWEILLHIQEDALPVTLILALPFPIISP